MGRLPLACQTFIEGICWGQQSAGRGPSLITHARPAAGNEQEDLPLFTSLFSPDHSGDDSYIRALFERIKLGRMGLVSGIIPGP